MKFSKLSIERANTPTVHFLGHFKVISQTCVGMVEEASELL